MSATNCFVCGATYYNDNETLIKIERIERNRAEIRTTKWGGMVCDKCLRDYFGLGKVIDDDRDR